MYLSDGGHFENLGPTSWSAGAAGYIVVCDAGADPGLSFWDLGSLVRKCRQDFGIRIEIDISPLMKKEGSSYAKWHCAVGQIHYDDVDVEALPGTLDLHQAIIERRRAVGCAQLRRRPPEVPP